MKRSKLPFTTDDELLKPLIQDPTKFALLLLRLQNDFEVYFRQIYEKANDENAEETLRHSCREVIFAVLPVIATTRVIIEQFNPTNVSLSDYNGLSEACTYIRSLIDQKLTELCQTSENA